MLIRGQLVTGHTAADARMVCAHMLHNLIGAHHTPSRFACAPVQYGNELESVALNFSLALYQPFLASLDSVRVSGIQAHITELRDGGSLQAVADAGQQAQQAAGQVQQAQPVQQAQQGEQASGQGKQAQQAGSGAAAAAAARTTASPEQPATAEKQAAYDPAAAAQRASVPPTASAERQQEQRSRGAPPAAGPAAAAVAAAAVAETSAAAAARGMPAAAAAAPAAPNAEVLAAAQGVLQQLRTLTAAEQQQGALGLLLCCMHAFSSWGVRACAHDTSRLFGPLPNPTLYAPCPSAAAYRRDELPQVQVAQAMYAEVQAVLAAVPRLSEVRAHGCMGMGVMLLVLEKHGAGDYAADYRYKVGGVCVWGGVDASLGRETPSSGLPASWECCPPCSLLITICVLCSPFSWTWWHTWPTSRACGTCGASCTERCADQLQAGLDCAWLLAGLQDMWSQLYREVRSLAGEVGLARGAADMSKRQRHRVHCINHLRVQLRPWPGCHERG